MPIRRIRQLIVCRRNLIHRDTLAAASAIYKGRPHHSSHPLHSDEFDVELHGDEEGFIPATFQVIFVVRSIQCSTDFECLL